MSEDLFGNELPAQPAPAPAPKVKPGNNMDTVIKVLERAMGDDGYVLVGPTGQPHRLREDKRLTPCIFWEAAVVHDLIRSSLLKVGAQKWMDTRHGRKPCQSVLVPRATRNQLVRWKALKPLHGKGKGAA
ncbi:hypothetical protein [Kutzneria kofuensis]|uniref:Uncharacterized protein n=1 Tax=Kutzneria kofuensis TaxID=103725 RepID=A0A7W9KEA7_9PSEU|nr:hypothetical protein [Kutzneria kofuensis]MBB5891017.1 hypothetical protein [Kutzneria kofuensis]